MVTLVVSGELDCSPRATLLASTVSTLPHFGHLKVRPMDLLGAWSLAVQDEQAMESDTVGLSSWNGFECD